MGCKEKVMQTLLLYKSNLPCCVKIGKNRLHGLLYAVMYCTVTSIMLFCNVYVAQFHKVTFVQLRPNKSQLLLPAFLNEVSLPGSVSLRMTIFEVVPVRHRSLTNTQCKVVPRGWAPSSFVATSSLVSPSSFTPPRPLLPQGLTPTPRPGSPPRPLHEKFSLSDPSVCLELSRLNNITQLY